MLVINFKGITPQQRFYSIGVQGDNKANTIKFVIERFQNDIDLIELAPYLKLASKCGKYADKIDISEDFSSDEDFVYLYWEMTRKSTQFRNLELQLSFEKVGEDNPAVIQTMIAELELSGTINVDKTLQEEEPSILRKIEDELDDHEERITDLEQNTYNKAQTNELLSHKVDKIEGKGLSTNDYTNADKTKLEGIEPHAQVNVIEGVQVDGNDLPVVGKKVNVNISVKVDKSNSPSIVYGTNEEGEQIVIPADQETGKAVRRKAENDDNISVPLTPAENTDATSKGYVEGRLANYYNKNQVDSKLLGLMKYIASLTVAQINALDTSTLRVGYFYNVTDNGIITLGDIEVYAGDNVVWTGTGWDKMTIDLSVYDDKFISAGFFEVENYDQDTGEITMIYESDLYDMSYNDNTGVLTIEAQ